MPKVLLSSVTSSSELLEALNFPGGSGAKESTCSAGDQGRGDPPGEGNGDPLQDSCLGQPTGRGAWWITVQGVAESAKTRE